jgi:hypothetical protein
MTALALFAASFTVVFLLGAQSLLVNNGRYAAAFANSIGIGLCNLLFFKLVPGADLAQTAAWIAGGPFGIVSAMYAFRHLHRRRQE